LAGAERGGRDRHVAEMAGAMRPADRSDRDHPCPVVRRGRVTQGSVPHGRRETLRSANATDPAAGGGERAQVYAIGRRVPTPRRCRSA
jgi:hypothetical protein